MNRELVRSTTSPMRKNSTPQTTIPPRAAGSALGLGRDHRGDEGEAGAQVAGHPIARDDQEQQCPDAREQDRRGRREPGQHRHQEGCPEHGHHVLHPDPGGPSPRQPFLRPDDRPGVTVLPSPWSSQSRSAIASTLLVDPLGRQAERIDRGDRGKASTITAMRRDRRSPALFALPQEVRLAFVRHGDPSGVPVLLLHPWSESLGCFDRLLLAPGDHARAGNGPARPR